MDIQALDKSHWKCFKLTDGSIYYGEISYRNSKFNIVPSLNEIPEEEKSQYKLIRQGVGVYIKGTSKYIGHWKNDQPCGSGEATIDTSVYNGEFNRSKFEGKGKFKGKGIHYNGEWKLNKLDGEGVLEANGDTIQGKFKQNHLDHQKLSLNPFITNREDLAKRIGSYKQLLKVEADKKKKLNKVKQICGYGDMDMIIKQIKDEEKALLITKSVNAMVSIQNIVDYLTKKGYLFSQINITEYIQMINNADKMNELKMKIVNVVEKGGIILIDISKQANIQPLPGLLHQYVPPALWDSEKMREKIFWKHYSGKNESNDYGVDE